jgi:hypothetical protein
LNDSIEGFGYNHHLADSDTLNEFAGINSAQTVMFKPLCGILAQTKYLPLRYTPLEFELELVSDPKDSLIEIDTVGSVFTSANTSLSWRLENFMIKVDMCTLDNALDNSYVSHVMSGKTLNIVYNTFISSLQTVLSNDAQINVSRSLTKLKSIFLTLDRNFEDERLTFYNKQFNSFWSPMATDSSPEVNNFHNITHEIKHLQVQIGSKLYPEYPIRSHAECFYSLRKALGVQSNNMHSIDIDGHSYRNNRFIFGLDTERLLGLAFTGTNTRNSLMTVHLKTGDPDIHANRMHIILLTEQILEIGGTLCTVYD